MISSTSSRRSAALFAGVLALAGTLCAPSPTADAQGLPGLPGARPAVVDTQGATPPDAEQEAPDSPRASVRAFLELTDGKGDFEAAARHLVVPADLAGRGPQLARRLAAVLERHLDIDLDAISPDPAGNVEDGLPDGVDRLGEVTEGDRGPAPVFIVRARDDRGIHWAFSRHTVERIDGWYERLEDRWIRDALPAPLLRRGPGGLMGWQWLALPLFVLLALAIGRVLGGLTRALLHNLSRRTATHWDDRLIERVGPSLTILWAVAALAVLQPWLALLPGARQVVSHVLAALSVFAVFWAIWRSVDVFVQILLERPWAADNPSARSLLSVGGNLVRVFVGVAGAVTVVASFGYPVGTVLAGLGIGGIALAFGAQKTVENLFGSVALAADQPFRVGDFVRIEDFVGTVERIGSRSTRVRTLDRTLITIPNGKLSDMRLESFAQRDRIRLALTVGVVYETTGEQMQVILAGIEKVLRDHPKIWPDTVVVRFAGFGASSLDIEIMCWFATTDFDEFRVCRQDVLLGMMKVVEGAGSGFAFPTRTVHVVTRPAQPPEEVTP